MNDASYTQSPLQGYGPESLASLSATSHKWDPEGVFQKLQNSGFLLSKVHVSWIWRRYSLMVKMGNHYKPQKVSE